MKPLQYAIDDSIDRLIAKVMDDTISPGERRRLDLLLAYRSQRMRSPVWDRLRNLIANSKPK